jgi:O-acetyl-ADP-ribose deacetylase (regulator of RNase III)
MKEEEHRANIMIEILILKVNVMSVTHKTDMLKENLEDTIREMRMKNPEKIAMIAKTTISAKIAGNNQMSIAHLVVVEVEEKIAPKEDLMINLIEITLQS